LIFWIVLCFVGTFLAGGLAGAGIQRLSRPSSVGAIRAVNAGVPPWLEEMHLSAEQRARAEAITASYRPRIQAILQESAPRVKSLAEDMENELLGLLDDAQRRRAAELRSRPESRPPRFIIPR
jgi:hypothetical protein